MGITVISGPAEEPVTVSGMRDQLRIDTSDSDTLLGLQITAAREWIEDYTGRALVTQTLDYSTNTLSDSMLLPRSPVQSITSITLLDEDDVETAVSTTAYRLDTTSVPHRTVRKINEDYPSVDLANANAVTIRIVAGYGDETAVPESMKAAIKLLVSHWFENREPLALGTIATPLKFTLQALLDTFRIHRSEP